MAHSKIGRNDLCFCGSGKKYKRCCISGGLSAGVTDPAWRNLRALEARVIVDLLVPYFHKNYPIEILDMAWEEFLLDVDLPEHDLDGLWKTMFIPWYLFIWCLPSEQKDKGTDKNTGEKIGTKTGEYRTVALEYAAQQGAVLEEEVRAFIEAMDQAYYSFYVITEAVPEKGLRLRDFFLQTEHFVKEYKGSKVLQRGDILYTKILTLQDQSICIGVGTYVDAECFYSIICLRKHLESLGQSLDQSLGKNLTAGVLQIMEPFLRYAYLEMIQPKEPPVLQNMDDEDIVLCTLYFDLDMDIMLAYEKLQPLIMYAEDSVFEWKEHKGDQERTLESIEFDWTKKGKKIHKIWKSKVLGHVTIRAKEIVVSVNSCEREEKIKELMQQYLGDKVRYRFTSIESIEEVIQNGTLEEERTDLNSLNLEDPFVQEQMKKLQKTYWENWLKIPVPALEGLAPKAASKTKDGRELLEAMFLYMERRDVGVEDGTQVDVGWLRAKLKLDPSDRW